MVFSSVEFLFFFLPLTLAAVFAVPARARNHVLLVASLFFYIWGGGALVLLLLVSIVGNHLATKLILRGLTRKDRRLRITGVTLSLVVSLGMLSYFKYANFIVAQLNRVGETVGVGSIAWTSVALPIGISFYTFQAVSYTVDVARGRVEPARNLVDYALYISMFPQLIAGPIVQFHQIAHDLRHRSTRMDDVAEGALRFMWGLSKKVLLADSLAPVANAAFDGSPGDLSTVGAWIGVLAYTFQIYFDFSGYSDMAIGIGRILGFRFPENFERPYSALSITDFWRRWHMTLSGWFRNYLYIPLGGNRGSNRRTNLNLMVVFATTGLWHGAAWTFLTWGLLHGAALLWERWRDARHVDDAPHIGLARARTLLLVMLLWVVFRTPTIGSAFSYWRTLVGGGSGWISADAVLTTTEASALAAMAVGVATLFMGGRTFVGRSVSTGVGPRRSVARFALLAGVWPLTLIVVVSSTFSPFLYFQF